MPYTMVTKPLEPIAACTPQDSFGIRYGVRILKIPKILIMKVVQVFFRNGFIPEEQAIIILIQVIQKIISQNQAQKDSEST